MAIKFTVQKSPKKGSVKHLLELIEEMQGQINAQGNEMRAMVEAEVAKNLGDKIHLMNSTLTDIMVQRKIFIEKGFITRDEINAKYEALKAGK